MIPAEDDTALIAQVIDLVAAGVPPNMRGQITPEIDLLESKLIDSFGLIQLVGDVETRLGVEVRTEDLTLEYFSTVLGIVALLQRYRDGMD